MKAALIATILSLTALLTGCGSTRIARILAEPSRYQNRNVTVEGRVTTAFGANLPGLNLPGLYQVEDGTGKIYVVSTRGVPTKDARVRVKGTVTPGLSLGGRSFGTAIRAKDFDVRY
ncbi:MAG TPA: hypothetical protein VES20_08785 [Bryobacteraceae bacterium]|nr:hypothetical protein [Bryobacteraceae bacterium]